MSDRAFPLPGREPSVHAADTIGGKRLKVAGYFLVFGVPTAWADDQGLFSVEADGALRIAGDFLVAQLEPRLARAHERALIDQ